MFSTLLLAALHTLVVDACSRVIYSWAEKKTAKKNYMTARSMDWFEDTDTALYAFPAGMVRDGGVGAGSLEWVSNYGSVVATVYELASMDGLNTEGLGVNVLYLTESDHGNDWREDKGQKKLSVGAWGQYTLDMFATVKDAVEWWSADEINIIAPPLPGGHKASGHVAITDKHGDSAVFEYLKGHLVIHHGPEYTVMTNSPPFAKQLAITAYWKEVGGLNSLPGTHRAADRFARLAWNANAVPEADTYMAAVTTTASLIRHISVPYGVTDPDKPNIASTIWRTISDHSGKKFFFEPVDSWVAFWVDLNNMNLEKDDPVMKLDYHGKVLHGDVSGQFEESEPFKFIKPGPEETPAPTNGSECPVCEEPQEMEMEDLFGGSYTVIGEGGKLFSRLCEETPCSIMNAASCKANQPRCKWDSQASPKVCLDRKDYPCSKYNGAKWCEFYNELYGATCSWDGSNCS